MNAKTVFSTALVWTVVSLTTVSAQTPGVMQRADTMPAAQTNGGSETLPAPSPQTAPQNFQLSSWIRGDKYGCCGDVGCDGPISTELFFRTGPSIVVGNGTVADVLQTGLYIGAGARFLFFDPEVTHAWTVELGIANIYNHAHAPSTYVGIPLNILLPSPASTPTNPIIVPSSPLVTLRDLNRTYFDFAGGREWYIWGSGDSGGRSWRIGADLGGRWGSEMAEFDLIRHRNDTIAGITAAAHTDIEIPLCGCCIFQAGLRVEYGYTWSDIMQIQNKSDVQDVNILFSVGVRY